MNLRPDAFQSMVTNTPQGRCFHCDYEYSDAETTGLVLRGISIGLSMIPSHGD